MNTGWTGGSYDTGTRIRLAYTRAIVDAIHAGELEEADSATTPIFNLKVSSSIKPYDLFI